MISLNTILAYSLITIGILILVEKNIIMSIMCLILEYFISMLWLISLEIEFISYVYIIVYIGAITILFLFVIMLIDVNELIYKFFKEEIKKKYQEIIWSVAVLITTINILEKTITQMLNINIINWQYKTNILTNKNYYDIMIFGNILYTKWMYLMVIISILLLSAMIGSLICALGTEEKQLKKKK